MSSEVSISINNISKVYEMYDNPRHRLLQLLSFREKKYYKEFWALKNISFELNKGETVGILGRNGSGKSTLLQIIAGTLTPTTGEIKTSGMIAALLELGSGFNPEFTGRENIYLNGSILGFTKSMMDKKLNKILDFADIGEHIDQPVKSYSSGMAVRLAFAVQACIEPQILIVDEALAVGDEKFQRKCYDYIESLRKNGCSILLVTHSTATIEKFCQRAVLLHKGEMHAIGDAKTVIDQYHALLYSDEQTYLRYINNLKAQDTSLPNNVVINNENNENNENKKINSKEKGLSAQITSWSVEDENGSYREVYETDEKVKISFNIDIINAIKELQAGLLIRTVEGVSVFGTSTLYNEKNIYNVNGGEKWKLEFTLKLSLCPGTYFITLAIAEAVSLSDMSYLDRKTDVIILKVNQRKLTASGIASLESHIDILREN